MSSRASLKKEELPLASSQEIETVVSQFESSTLPYKHWTHRAHLSVAIYYLAHMTFDEALARIRNNINLYNSQCGDPAGYNETITVLFLRKIAHDMTEGISLPEPHLELARLTEVLSVEWIYRYYSKALIWSENAKRMWVEPDISPLDF